MKKVTTRMITINSIIIAIFLLFALVPSLGYITIGPVSLTLMHILFLIGMYALYITMNLNLIWAGLIYGLIFGLSSLIQTLISPGPTSFIFLNPLFSVVPRVLMGLCVGILAYFLTKTSVKVETKIYTNQITELTWYQRHYLKIYNIIIAFTAATLNTIFFLVFMYFIGPLIYNDPDQQRFFHTFTWIILATNYLPEMLLAVAIFSPVAYALKKLYNNN
ncbi:ECF transporter S component [Spiroplasma endosymbiont of Megaselia nigra]|uniref:ECF transporter S component n=1 Tax=Spiroplasma endosymbiont of Megaselia nigra TaxID=2478537 RepID=UPI000F89C611|nr:ECF transporter S component [Spiroplasma endosymbiont of Megaselia nigra]RUO86596.1 ECF transporter S component [Spiroplasma endosymbiont of Megaselia nigra]